MLKIISTEIDETTGDHSYRRFRYDNGATSSVIVGHLFDGNVCVRIEGYGRFPGLIGSVSPDDAKHLLLALKIVLGDVAP